ncbi:MAG: hypothetical protein ACT4PU_11990 [Planctomycetota bacterium]
MKLGLFLVSAAVLLLQLVQTRIFSVMLWHHLTYLVVTFTMLGFATGGALLACRPAWTRGDVRRTLGWLGLLFGLSELLAYVLLTRAVPEASHTSRGIATAAFDYALLLIPMIFAGMAVALALAEARGEVGRAYAVNMIGSAMGCVLYVPALRTLGGEGTVLLAVAITLLGAASFCRGRALSKLAAVAGLACLALSFWAPTALFRVPLATSKAMAQHLARDPSQHIELTKWDPLCRLDVIGPKDPAQAASPSIGRVIYQDGDASTVLVPGAAHTTANPFDKEGLAYLLFRDRAPKVLAIGVGGGIDIVQSQTRRAWMPEGATADFTGVEINPTTAGLMLNEYRALSGDRYFLPGVRVLVDEGRSWLRRSPEQYDIIQMTGTDTYAALASGSYVMSESYLYTAEAYDDFLDHLTPDGVISVLRFRFTPPRETLRLAAIAVDALRRDGAAQPADHVIMLGFDGNRIEVDGQLVGMDFGALLIGKRAFRPDEVELYRKYAERLERVHIMYAPGATVSGPTADYFTAVRAGTDGEFRESYVYNLAPVTDDTPFFFRYDKWDAAINRWLGRTTPQTAPGGTASEYTGIVGGEPIGLIMLTTVLVESSLLVALLVLVPLLLFRREGLRVPGAGRWILYFFGLGAGYVLLEVVAMQRFVLFLGNPGYAITVVLITFLLFSGLGAAAAGKSTDPRRTLVRSLLGVLVLTAVLGLALPSFFDLALRLPLVLRIVLSVVVLAPPAYLMGMPFPSGLALLSRGGAPLVPWACGVNGGASVIASVIGILLAMASGFSMVYLLAGAAYGAALLAGRGAKA